MARAHQENFILNEALFLDASETQRLLSDIAQIMAEELHKDAEWIKNEIHQTEQILKTYLL